METHIAVAADYASLRDFVFSQHVEASSFSEASRAAQIADLPTDFPDLLDDEGSSLRRGAWLCKGPAGEIVAAVGLKKGAGGSVDLSFLFVHPAYRRRGLARRLLHTALHAAAALEGVKAVNILTLEGTYDAAIALYRSEGFRISARVAPSESGGCPHYTLLYMRLDNLAPWHTRG